MQHFTFHKHTINMSNYIHFWSVVHVIFNKIKFYKGSFNQVLLIYAKKINKNKFWSHFNYIWMVKNDFKGKYKNLMFKSYKNLVYIEKWVSR